MLDPSQIGITLCCHHSLDALHKAAAATGKQNNERNSKTKHLTTCVSLALWRGPLWLLTNKTNLLVGNQETFWSDVVKAKDESPIEITLPVKRAVMNVCLLLLPLSAQPADWMVGHNWQRINKTVSSNKAPSMHSRHKQNFKYLSQPKLKIGNKNMHSERQAILTFFVISSNLWTYKIWQIHARM